MFLEISQNSSGLRPATLLKKTLAQIFSCEFCEFSYSKTLFLTVNLRWLLLKLLGKHLWQIFENSFSLFTGLKFLTFIIFRMSLLTLLLRILNIDAAQSLYVPSCPLALLGFVNFSYRLLFLYLFQEI